MNIDQLEAEMLAKPVSSLQFMLRRLSKRYEELPELIPDGRFGERTLEAVMRFQKRMGMPVTGVVDQQTWTVIRDAWLSVERELAPPRPLRGLPETGEYAKAGDSAAHLLLVQSMFQSLGRLLEGLETSRMDGVNSAELIQNAKWLQKRAGLPETGSMDKETWNTLVRLYEMFVVRQPQEISAHLPALGRG